MHAARLRLVDRQRLANSGRLRSLDKGEELLGEGVVGPGMFVVLSGKLSVRRSSGTTEYVEPGATLGHVFLSIERESDALVTAEVPSQVALLSRERLRSLAFRRPWLGVELMARIAAAHAHSGTSV